MNDFGNAKRILEMKILRRRKASLGSYKGFWKTPTFSCLLHGSRKGDFMGSSPIECASIIAVVFFTREREKVTLPLPKSQGYIVAMVEGSMLTTMPTFVSNKMLS